MRRSRLSGALLVAACLLVAGDLKGQVATGFPVYGSFGGGTFDTVDNANNNVHFEIPVINKAGRGMPLTYKLTYDSSIWTPVGSSGSQVWTPAAQWGWNSMGSPSTGTLQLHPLNPNEDSLQLEASSGRAGQSGGSRPMGGVGRVPRNLLFPRPARTSTIQQVQGRRHRESLPMR
jgi:hypothetical protein